MAIRCVGLWNCTYIGDHILYSMFHQGQDFSLNVKFLTLLGFTSFCVPLFHPWGKLVQAGEIYCLL